MKLINRTKCVIFILSFFHFTAAYCASTFPVSGNRIFVDISNTMGSQDGQNWSTAFVHLQDALLSSSKGDTVCIAAGTYFPDLGGHQSLGARESTFEVRDSVFVFGAFPVGGGTFTERDTALHTTILSGDINIGGDRTDNVYHVVTFNHVGPETLIDGVTIEKGEATTAGMFNNHGAGIINVATIANAESSPMIQNCTIRNNRSLAGGAGMYNEANAMTEVNPKIINTQFYNNETTMFDSGGIQNAARSGSIEYLIESCHFINNKAATAGGAILDISTMDGKLKATIIQTIFDSNSSLFDGGSISERTEVGESNITITDCVFNNNIASNGGGAIIIYSNQATGLFSVEINGTIFTQNQAVDYAGGAIFNQAQAGENYLKINNCEFTDNVAGSSGGAIFNYANLVTSELEIDVDSSSFERNTSGDYGGAISLQSDTITLLSRFNHCEFNDNKAIISGGGLCYFTFSEFSSIEAEILNCSFLGNKADVGGGLTMTSGNGLINSNIIQSLFARDTARISGAIYLNAFDGMIASNIINCTIAKNVSDTNGAIGALEEPGTINNYISNSILWDNDNAAGFASADINASTSTIDYSIIDSASCSEIGPNVTCGPQMLYNQNPYFLDADNNDFRLPYTSAAIDAGFNMDAINVNLLFDLDGLARIENGTVDLGVYEFYFECVPIIDLTDQMINPLTYLAMDQVIANTKILHDESTLFMASQNALLNGGFEVILGSEFEIKMQGCGAE